MLAHEVETILGLLVAVAAIVAVSRRLPIPYPILLILGGLILSFLPGLPMVSLRPELVFLLFLPPLLYWEALTAPLRDFRHNAYPIFSLAFGLVLATTVVVALVAHALIPGLSWPAAFVLGAVVAPTDEVAVAEVANHLPIPDRVLTILEGESLINDAISLVIYRMAIAATVTGAFSLGSAGLQFLKVGIGGTVVGLAVGWAIGWLRRLLPEDPLVENTISLLTPFAAYLPAEALGTSGVLAVVAIGLYLGRQGPRFVSSRTRLQAQALWQMITFLLNGVLFILTGFQLRLIRSSGFVHVNLTILGYIAAILGVVLLARLLWVFFHAYVPRVLFSRRPTPPWQQTLLIALGGIRGGMSLVTALAIPLTLAGGRPFPDRDLLICIAFFVILATLLLQGLSLPWLIPRLHLPEEDGGADQEETQARLAAVKAALSRLKELTGRGKSRKDQNEAQDGSPPPLDPEIVADLRDHYQRRLRHLTSRARGEEREDEAASLEAYRNLRRALIQAERDAVLRLRDEEAINEDALRRIQQDLDLEALRLEPPESL